MISKIVVDLCWYPQSDPYCRRWI